MPRFIDNNHFQRKQAVVLVALLTTAIGVSAAQEPKLTFEVAAVKRNTSGEVNGTLQCVVSVVEK